MVLEDKMITIFSCNRGGGVKPVKIQLELPRETIEAYKIKAKEFEGGKYTAKQVMENMLRNWVDGVVGT
jgi:hypothetical protein